MGNFPMGNWCRFPLRKARCDSRSTQPSLIPSLMYAIFWCDRTTGCEAYSFTADGYGIFNMCTINLGARCTHEGGSGTNKSAKQLTRKDLKKNLLLTLPHQGIEPRVFRFDF